MNKSRRQDDSPDAHPGSRFSRIFYVCWGRRKERLPHIRLDCEEKRLREKVLRGAKVLGIQITLNLTVVFTTWCGVVEGSRSGSQNAPSAGRDFGTNTHLHDPTPLLRRSNTTDSGATPRLEDPPRNTQSFGSWREGRR